MGSPVDGRTALLCSCTPCCSYVSQIAPWRQVFLEKGVHSQWKWKCKGIIFFCLRAVFTAALLLSPGRTVFLLETWDHAPTDMVLAGLQSHQGGRVWSSPTLWLYHGSLTGNYGFGWHLSVSYHFGEKAHQIFLTERCEPSFRGPPSLAGLPELETCAGSSSCAHISSWIRVSRWWLPNVGKEATGCLGVFVLGKHLHQWTLPASSVWVMCKWDTPNLKFWNIYVSSQ